MSVPEGIEGDCGDFHIRLLREEDAEILQEHLKANFYRDEPLAQLTGYSDELADDMSCLWRKKISQNLSIIAFDKRNNKVAGARLTVGHYKGESDPVPEITSPAAKKIMTVMSTLFSKVDIYDNFGVDRFAEFLLVSVDREYRGKGLAMELYVRSIALIKSQNFPLVECIFTHPHTRHNGNKLGFQELLRMRTVDFKNEKGEVLFSNATPDQLITFGALQL